MQLLFLNPVFKERLWGGTTLKSRFNLSIPSEHTGECWAISAHKNGETTIKNGEFAGWGLSKLWRDHPELFANANELPATSLREFPLLVKILDANADLSVQVHPNDEYAQQVEGELGKAECWYILDAKPDAKIVYGHTANSLDEFKQLALSGKWNELLTTVAVKSGDFFDVPTGTVHAIGAGILILEVQQSSDTTYRLYDYDRRDDSGQPRELHLDKSFAVVSIPHRNNLIKPVTTDPINNAILTMLVSNNNFQVQKLEVFTGFASDDSNDNLIYPIKAKYLLVTAIEGNAIINGYAVNKGDSFIVPNQVRQLEIEGKITLIMSNES